MKGKCLLRAAGTVQGENMFRNKKEVPNKTFLLLINEATVYARTDLCRTDPCKN